MGLKRLLDRYPELESIQRIVEALADLAIERYDEFLEGEPIKPKWGGTHLDPERAEALERIASNSGLWGNVNELIRDMMRDLVLGKISVEEVAQRVKKGREKG